MRPPTRGPMTAPILPIESTNPVAVPTSSLDTISIGSASIMGIKALRATPTRTMNGQLRGILMYIAPQAARARVIAGIQRNGFLKPSLQENLGINKAVGIPTQRDIETISPAMFSVAPFIIINAGAQADQLSKKNNNNRNRMATNHRCLFWIIRRSEVLLLLTGSSGILSRGGSRTRIHHKTAATIGGMLQKKKTP